MFALSTDVPDDNVVTLVYLILPKKGQYAFQVQISFVSNYTRHNPCDDYDVTQGTPNENLQCHHLWYLH